MRFKPCSHLAGIWEYLAAKKISIDHDSVDALYYGAILPRAEVEAAVAVSDEVEFKEYGIAGQYAGFICSACNKTISGHHPNREENMRKAQGSGPFT